MKKSLIIKRMVFIAAFSAISMILYVFPKFSLFFFPSFLEINFSLLPIIIAAFMLGPVDAIAVVLIRFATNLAIEGTITAGVGEIFDLILGSALALTAGLSYKFMKFKHKDLVTVAITFVVWIILAAFLNAFYSVPQYINLYFGGDINLFVNSLKVINGVNSSNYLEKYIFFAVIPFNIILSVIVLAITLVVHRRLRVLYDMIDFSNNKCDENMK